MATRSRDRNFGYTTSLSTFHWITFLSGVQDLHLTCDAQMKKKCFVYIVTLRDSDEISVYDGDTRFVLSGRHCSKEQSEY